MSEQSNFAGAFVALLRAHAGLARHFNTRLLLEHGLTISDFEVLLHLGRAPDRRLRRVDLADRVLLSASGVTRLLDGLERLGLVERQACPRDRRVVYAVLTDVGLGRLRAAAEVHFRQVEEHFSARFDPSELDQLTSLLARLDEADTTSETPSCSVP